uniref:Retrotransposon protein, putative, Ty3-gypsy subclass n=1 Tax=Oryza sativa subsp. japonica TaxID=39947 RepID=Q2QT90_ORYSJ|nr:retrotransposon protein, putative, Ty3-gypsy subclass [Oryza sativa Japonica Group]
MAAGPAQATRACPSPKPPRPSDLPSGRSGPSVAAHVAASVASTSAPRQRHMALPLSVPWTRSTMDRESYAKGPVTASFRYVVLACRHTDVDLYVNIVVCVPRLEENAQLKGLPAPGGVRIRTTPRKSTTAPVRIQLAPRNPPPPVVPAAPAAPAPVPAPVPVSAPASALSFTPASAVRGPASGNGGWLPATPNGSHDRGSSSSSGSEPGSGETYLPGSRSRSEGPGDEQDDAFDSTDRRSRSEH